MLQRVVERTLYTSCSSVSDDNALGQQWAGADSDESELAIACGVVAILALLVRSARWIADDRFSTVSRSTGAHLSRVIGSLAVALAADPSRSHRRSRSLCLPCLAATCGDATCVASAWHLESPPSRRCATILGSRRSTRPRQVRALPRGMPIARGIARPPGVAGWSFKCVSCSLALRFNRRLLRSLRLLHPLRRALPAAPC